MKLFPSACLLLAFFSPLLAQAPADKSVPEKPSNDKAWIERSNSYTQLLLDIQKKHSPEAASAQGLSEYDTEIGKPTLADENTARKETEVALVKIQAGEKTETNKYVLEDLTILDNRVHLGFRRHDYSIAHEVPFLNASSYVFQGLRALLDDQTAASRRPAAVVRLRKYAGSEAGYTPLVDLLKQRDIEQMAKPGVIYPAKTEIETELSRNSNYIDGIAMLFKKYNQTGWEEPYAKLKTQLADYDAWVRATILPKARTDFRLPPEEYALNLEGFGIDIPPAQLAGMAHAAFTEYQGEMQTIAAQIAKQHNMPSSDYRDVIAALKKQQLTGDAILPFYEQRLKDIEGIIVTHNIVTLPDRPAIIRIASAAESSQQPAPHMEPPPFLNNTGQRGVFVLPLNLPPAAGAKTAAKIDDFAFDAAAWTLTAHEARPGHELQFDSMVEHGTSRARVLYAFNSTNVEGWGLYAEYLMKPYMPLEGQLISLQLRLQRAARAFMDPELQSGKIQPADAMRIMTHDVCLSEPFAQTEVERYTFRSPGQANSYFYGYTKLLALRKDTEGALGSKFDQKKFHDFILLQGLLPPDLMRKAVMEDFVPSQK